MTFREMYLRGGLATTEPEYKEHVESIIAFLPCFPREKAGSQEAG